MSASDSAGPDFDIRQGLKSYYESFNIGTRRGVDVQLLIARVRIKGLD